MRMLSQRTAIERLQLITGLLCALHTIQKRTNSRIFFAPEIIGNCDDGQPNLVRGKFN